MILKYVLYVNYIMLRAAVNLVHPTTLESHIVKVCTTRTEALNLAISQMRSEIKESPLADKIKLVQYTSQDSLWHETEAHRLREAIAGESRKCLARGCAADSLPRVYVVSWTSCSDEE